MVVLSIETITGLLLFCKGWIAIFQWLVQFGMRAKSVKWNADTISLTVVVIDKITEQNIYFRE